MTLEKFAETTRFYGPYGFVRGNVFACGAEPEYYHEHELDDLLAVVEEYLPELLGYEVEGVCLGTNDGYEPYLEIGITGWEGLE